VPSSFTPSRKYWTSLFTVRLPAADAGDAADASGAAGNAGDVGGGGNSATELVTSVLGTKAAGGASEEEKEASTSENADMDNEETTRDFDVAGAIAKVESYEGGGDVA
jgi:hypothetical protein